MMQSCAGEVLDLQLLQQLLALLVLGAPGGGPHTLQLRLDLVPALLHHRAHDFCNDLL